MRLHKPRIPHTGLPARIHSPWPFLGLVLLWSWLFWVPVALAGWSMRAWPGSVLVALGGIAPLLAAFVLIGLFETREFRRDFWQRLAHPGRLHAPWWLAVLLVPVIPALLGIVSAQWSGGPGPSWQQVLPAAPDSPANLSLLLFYLLFGPLPEEPGWRGYALDRLVKLHGRVLASLILGLVWAVWHWPMFLIPDSILASRFTDDALLFWCGWFLPVLARSVLFTWVYYGSGRSILAVILLHFVFNVAAELLRLTNAMILWRSFWEVIMAALVLTLWHRQWRHLRRRRKSS